MTKKGVVREGGIGICGLLTIVFVIMKCLDKIDWSWWWVFSPLWIPIGIFLLALGVGLLIAFLIALFDKG